MHQYTHQILEAIIDRHEEETRDVNPTFLHHRCEGSTVHFSYLKQQHDGWQDVSEKSFDGRKWS